MEENKVIHEVVEETYRELFVKYEKALDKACECITHFQALHQGGLNKDKETTCKEWKEWLLKDE